jgi:hypothetical protein
MIISLPAALLFACMLIAFWPVAAGVLFLFAAFRNSPEDFDLTEYNSRITEIGLRPFEKAPSWFASSFEWLIEGGPLDF